MRVVIDTNVVVSAILRDRKPEEVSLFKALVCDADQESNGT